MSVILPRNYKEIADELGEAYAKLRDSIFEDGPDYTDSSLPNIMAISDSQDSVPDNTNRGSGEPDAGEGESEDPADTGYSIWLESGKVTAPEGTIAVDMGQPLSRLVTSTGTETNAKRVASGQFGGYLRSMNSHVVNRYFGVNSISGFYQLYAYVGDEDPDLNLFDSDPDTPGVQVDYFTADFCELSAQIGVTIEEPFCPPS